jgi:hypothetical protein
MLVVNKFTFYNFDGKNEFNIYIYIYNKNSKKRIKENHSRTTLILLVRLIFIFEFLLPCSAPAGDESANIYVLQFMHLFNPIKLLTRGLISIGVIL